MAVCEWCEREMKTADTCIPEAQPNAHTQGDEAHWRDPGIWDPSEPIPERCRDCGAHIGGHHHYGCLQAHCRTCGDQAMFCDLEDDEHRG